MKYAPIRADADAATPVDVKAYAPSKPVTEMTDAEFADWMESLPPCPGIRSVDNVDPEIDARAEADIAAGRGVPHALVCEWLRTVGTPDHKPMPREWFE